MELGRQIGRTAVGMLQPLRRRPVMLVVSLVALSAVGATVGAAVSTPGQGGSVGSSSLAARSGPSPGPSVVVRSDPSPGGQPQAGDGEDPSASEPEVNLSEFVELRDRDTTVFATDFTERDELDAEWEVYASPGHAGLGLRRPSAVSLEPAPETEGGSVLTITARPGTEGEEVGQIVSGGMALLRPRTYGTYTFRMRVDGDPAEVTSGVAILWPWSNRWPEDGELDIVETWANRSTRAPIESNIHFLDPSAQAPFDEADDRLLSIVHSGIDGTRWHTFRFDWRADRLSMAIDDGPLLVLTDDPLHIPDWSMVPTFQLDAFPAPGGSREDAALDGPVRLEVDWLVIEE